MKEIYISNAKWPLEVYRGMDGKGISTDTHESLEGAIAVCRALKRDGFGGQGKEFPLDVWVEKIDPENEGVNPIVWRPFVTPKETS